MFLIAFLTFSLLIAMRLTAASDDCVSDIQAENVAILEAALQQGYQEFCDANIDGDVLSMYPESSLSDVIIEIRAGNQSHKIFLRDVCKISQLGIIPEQRTLILINGFITSKEEAKRFLVPTTDCKESLNIIYVDFARNLALLYNLARNSLRSASYAVYKIVDTLLSHRTTSYNIILAGYSQGAQIAALAAKQLIKVRGKSEKLPILIAIDPAIACNRKSQHVSSKIAEQVVVFHGDHSGKFSVKEPCGTVDFYPNGDVRHQPGCKTDACSHLFAIGIFLETICLPANLMAVQCRNWSAFLSGSCDRNDVIAVSANVPVTAKGRYYCRTRMNSPFGLDYKGINMMGNYA